MQIKSVVTACLTTLLLSGCFESNAPKCSDKDVESLVKSLYKESLENLSNNPMAALFLTSLPKEIDSFSAIRPISYDKEVKLRSCKAVAHFDNNITANIDYTVQLSEDKKDEFYVELDTSFMEGLVQQSMMNSMLNHFDTQK